MEYIYDGVPVGMSPNLFSRNEKYLENLNRFSDNSLVVIDNFLSVDICNGLIKEVDSIAKDLNSLFWDDIMYSSVSIASQINNIIPKIKEEITKHYGVTVKEKVDPHVAKWKPGKFLKTHVDDLSPNTSRNHISTVIYLNNDYVGGELFFPKQNIMLSPKIGDLVIFPGNLNYPHEVKEILQGNRYTIPTWFRYI